MISCILTRTRAHTAQVSWCTHRRVSQLRHRQHSRVTRRRQLFHLLVYGPRRKPQDHVRLGDRARRCLLWRLYQRQPSVQRHVPHQRGPRDATTYDVRSNPPPSSYSSSLSLCPLNHAHARSSRRVGPLTFCLAFASKHIAHTTPPTPHHLLHHRPGPGAAADQGQRQGQGKDATAGSAAVRPRAQAAQCLSAQGLALDQDHSKVLALDLGLVRSKVLALAQGLTGV
jgi:hypothetical protein